MLLAPSASPFEICGYLLRCCEKINPQRIKDTPAVNFLSRLGYTSPISKGLRKAIYYVRLLKILNVSFPTWMSVVLDRSEFAVRTRR